MGGGVHKPSRSCGECYYRNPDSGYCPKKYFAVEADARACACFCEPARSMNTDPAPLPLIRNQIDTKPMETIIGTTKICKECGRELPLDEFPRNTKAKDHHLSICRECHGKRCAAGSKKEQPTEASRQEQRDETRSEFLAGIPDDVLVRELASRGWDVRCTRTLEIHLTPDSLSDK